MQPERQIGAAFTLLGAALVIPHGLQALRHDPLLLARGGGSLIAGNLLGGMGLFLLTLMLLDRGHPRGFRILMACGLIPVALAWIAIGPLVALRAQSPPALACGGSSLAPALGFGLGLYGALKN